MAMNFLKEWIIQYQNRYLVGTTETTITRVTGTVSQEGDTVKAEYLNEIQKNCIYQVSATRVVEGTVEFYDISIDGSDAFDVFDTQFIINFNETNTKLNPILRFNGNNYYIRFIENFIDVDVSIGNLQKTYIGFLDSTNNKLKLIKNERKLTFDTIADVQAYTGFVVGDIVKVLGYYSKNDGCVGELKVYPANSFVNTRHEGGMWFTLANGLTAKWVLAQNKHISIRQLGGKDDGIFDNTPAFIRARQLEYWVIDFPYVTNGNYYVAGYRPQIDSKDLEKGWYYNSLDSRVKITMEDLTPKYFGNLSNANEFLGAVNPIRFEFTNQNGKDMIIGTNYNIESAFLSNSPKITPERNVPISLDFTDTSWEYYYTKDLVVDPSLNGSITDKTFTWTANSAVTSRQGFIKKCEDGELLEISCFSNGDLTAIYGYFVSDDGYCYMLNIPVGTNVENYIKIYKITNTVLTLIKTDTTDLTMAGKTVDYFKIPNGGSNTIGLRKNKNILSLYINGIIILTFESDIEITKMGIGTSNNKLSYLKLLYPIMYQNSKPKTSKNIKVYCLGDSNTVGARANMRWEDYLPYVSRSYAGIGELTIGTVNAAIDITSGQVTPPDFSGHDYAIIMLGTNDSRTSSVVTTQIETYKSNIKILIDKAKADGVIPILATFGMLFDGADTGEGYLLDYTYKSGAYINVLKTLAHENNVEIAEVRDYLGNSWNSCYSDALHYNDVGHMEIAKAMSEALSRAINKFDKSEIIYNDKVGVDQEYTTPTRVSAISYRNTNGKPIQISMQLPANAAPYYIQVSKDDTNWVNVGSNSAGSPLSFTGIIPNLYYYRVTGGTVSFWRELV